MVARMTTAPPPARARLREIARRAMMEHDLLPDFSAAALRETGDVRDVPPSVAEGVRDLRPLLWASIDNDDSRDLDQLTVADGDHKAQGADGLKILVAIADVAATVARGSALDAHAAANTTSVYTAAQVFPMLPERLSTDLTSLGEGVDRRAFVLEMKVTADGRVTGSDVYRAIVRNRAKLAYNGVAAWLDGKGAAPAPLAAVPGLDAQLRLQSRVAQTMRARRQEHGALQLETLQPRPVFEGDSLADLLVDEGNRAKELIEDFMIGANGVAAQYLGKRSFPSLRRVLRTPERWPRIVELASGFGENLPVAPSAPALETFLTKRRAADPARFPDLSLAVVKLLGRGEYVLELPGRPAPGHFGLAVRDYTHSTAPNRRFPDLVMQRLLGAALAGAPAPYTNDELDALGRHCTEQEDSASKVERQVAKSAAALLLAPRVGQPFEAIVTGASDKGTWVRIAQPPVEGKLVRGFDKLDVGDRVAVELAGVDVDRGFIDFVRARGAS
jgi:VacB/RNase II family 3'-5' exoribonuclease